MKVTLVNLAHLQWSDVWALFQGSLNYKLRQNFSQLPEYGFRQVELGFELTLADKSDSSNINIILAVVYK